MVRNKAKGFPEDKKINDPKAKANHASRRANGEINTQPQERMARSHDPHDDQFRK